MSNIFSIKFRNSSLQQKLMSILMLTSGAALLIVTILLSLNIAASYRQAENEELRSFGDIIANNVSAALIFDDIKAAESTLSGLNAKPQIFAAAVVRKDYRIFAAYYGPSGGRPAYEKIREIYGKGSISGETLDEFRKRAGGYWRFDLDVVRPITFRGEEMGWVVLHSNVDRLLGRLFNLFIVVVFSLASSLLFAYFLSTRVQKHITEPVMRLSDAMQKISGSADYSLRVKKHGLDEIGMMTDNFNHMLDQICSRDEQLSTHQEQLEKSEKEFREISGQFSALLHAIPDSITLLSPDLEILWANQTSADGTSQDPSDVVGLHCYSHWFSRTEPCENCPVLTSFSTGEPSKGYIIHERREIEIRAVPVNGPDGAVNVIRVGRDITEHRNLEEQVRQSQKMEAIGQLAGGVAHDFNNILSAIIGYGDLVLMKMSKDFPLRKNVEQMREAADKAAYLTQSLLAFSRKQISNKRPLDLNDIIRKTGKFLQRVMGEDVELRTDLANLPINILADGHQIEQVLMNLATNARDAMPNGGTFTVSTERITVDENSARALGKDRQGDYALMTVSDTGTGMDRETQQRIFEPFFTTKEMGKGTGLGMAVIYGIITDHEGHINVQSEPGKGTIFMIYLPVTSVEVSKEEMAPSSEIPAGGTETILLAEDDSALRELTRSVLEEFGYNVIEAVNGEEAVERFMEDAGRISLVLSDLIMPRKSGKEACDEIRMIRPDIKVIFASGYAPDIVRQNIKVGPDVSVVLKPVSHLELLRKIRWMLDEGRD